MGSPTSGKSVSLEEAMFRALDEMFTRTRSGSRVGPSSDPSSSTSSGSYSSFFSAIEHRVDPRSPDWERVY